MNYKFSQNNDETLRLIFAALTREEWGLTL